MSSRETHSTMNVRVTPLYLLGLLFVGLKLTHYIDWSWWWVTLPFWGGLALAGSLFLVTGILYVLVRR